MELVDALNAPAAIVGTTGAGKTYAAKGAVEELLALGRRIVILDPTGAWWGLRSGADGDPRHGFAVTIFGGDHADIEVAPEHGAMVAEAIAGREVQAILDTSEMTGGEKTRFLTEFLQTLYAKNRAAMHLVVDEADEVCPQNPMPEERRLSGAFDKIVRRGRIKGFRPLMITQRPAVLHKNVLSQVGTLIALKLTSPQDRKAIEDWVKGNADTGEAKTVMSSLPTLARGEGWVWSPAAGILERRAFPAIRTFDSSRTPGADEAVVEPALSPVDVDALREAMRQSEPEKPVGKKHGAADLAAAEERGYLRGLVDGQKLGFADGLMEARRRVVDFAGTLAIEDIAVVAQEPRTAAEPAPHPVRPPQRKPAAKGGASGTDPLLAAALSVWPVRLTWGQLASMCGRKARGGHFNTARKALIEGGLVRTDGELVTPTDPPAAPEGAIPADLLEQNLPQPASKMFAAIRTRPGITAIGLATVLSMQPRGGHWNTGMSTLRRNGLIEESGDRLSIPATLLGTTARNEDRT